MSVARQQVMRQSGSDLRLFELSVVSTQRKRQLENEYQARTTRINLQEPGLEPIMILSQYQYIKHTTENTMWMNVQESGPEPTMITPQYQKHKRQQITYSNNWFRYIAMTRMANRLTRLDASYYK